MILEDYSQSWLSLLPAIVTIFLAVVTRRVILALFAGALTGAILLSGFSPGGTVIYLFEEAVGIFWSWKEALPQSEKIFILSFVLLLGILFSLIEFSGGTAAFSRWVGRRIDSPVKAQMVTLGVGVVMFIDDYMNALVSGNACRPIMDRQKVSRAKLAYIIDCTSAPVSVLAPFSSWGAYLISLIAMVVTTSQMGGDGAFIIFIKTIPYNFYALVSLGLVLLVILFKLDIFQMLQHEKNATTGDLYDKRKGEPAGTIQIISEKPQGSAMTFFIPVVVLIVVSIAAMILTGAYVAGKVSNAQVTLLIALEHTAPGLSLVLGALASIMTVFVISIIKGPGLTIRDLLLVIVSGVKAMKSAIIILLFAWLLVAVTTHMASANFLSEVISGSSIVDVRFIPALIFAVSCVIAFSTGSSWGTFGVMMPIAISVATAANPDVSSDFIVLSIAAMIAGAVFGDHCSPISDTTILSSVGAGCHHIDHVITQIPYCIISALVAFSGYLVMGWTFSPLAGFMTIIMAVAIVFLLLLWVVKMRKKFKNQAAIFDG